MPDVVTDEIDQTKPSYRLSSSNTPIMIEDTQNPTPSKNFNAYNTQTSGANPAVIDDNYNFS